MPLWENISLKNHQNLKVQPGENKKEGNGHTILKVIEDLQDLRSLKY